MGLFGDYKEAKDTWSRATKVDKLILVVSTFFALSSVASLSEILIKWKSFFKDAIDIYRQFITDNIIWLLDYIHLTLPQYRADIIILITLMVSGSIRAKLPGVRVMIVYYLIYTTFMVFGLFPITEEFTAIHLLVAVVMTFSVPFLISENHSDRFKSMGPIIISIALTGVLGAINAVI